MSPGWSLVIGTAELSADLSQSPAQGSVAASPAPGAVSCRRHDGAIESAGSGLSILQTPIQIQPWTAGCRFGSSLSQHSLGPSRGSPAAAPVPRFPSAGTSFSCLRLFDPPAPDTAAGRRLPVRLLYPQLRIWSRAPAAGPAPRSPAPDPAANLHTIGEW